MSTFCPRKIKCGHFFRTFIHIISGGEAMDKKEMEKFQQKKNQEKFNSVTQKSRPENQNQAHNVKSEGVETKIRQMQNELKAGKTAS